MRGRLAKLIDTTGLSRGDHAGSYKEMRSKVVDDATGLSRGDSRLPRPAGFSAKTHTVSLPRDKPVAS
jgi:hypothetical protein